MAKEEFLNSLKKAAERKEKDLKEKPSQYIAKPKDKTGIDPLVIAYHDPKSSIAENYRAIYSHLKSLSEVKSFAVTSSSQQEGKSVTAANLSIVIANDFEKKVLLVDANFRNPSIDELLNLEVNKGLKDILTKSENFRKAVTSTSIENLDVITSGSNAVNPVELLSAQNMGSFINEARSSYDYVICDTPAIIPYADAKIIAPLTEGIILTVRAQHTRREVVDRAKSIIDKLNINVLGYVLTDIEHYIPEYIYKHL
jgi:capsular exopolysaccharide synthesis family protein